MNDLDGPAQPENRREAKRWLVIVEEDIDVADAAAHLPLPRRGASAYHLQQAAEKLAKALMVLNGKPFRWSQDLDDLAGQLIPIYPQFSVTLDALRHLTIWSVAYRYPALEDEAEPLPTIEELERYAALLKKFKAEVCELIGQD
jgi:HEPN domain-containing protein